MISRSISPVSFETSAHVRRETTADLILVRSPSRARELQVERLADDQIQHRVAEEFHPLVAVEPGVGDRGVGQRLLEQIRVPELVPENPLGMLMQFGSHATHLPPEHTATGRGDRKR